MEITKIEPENLILSPRNHNLDRDKAIQMSPDNAMYYAFLAIAYQTLGDIPNASNAIDKAIELMPTAAAKEIKKELDGHM